MTNATTAPAIFLGLKLYELLTLLGIVAGPIVAVAITLLTERWRKSHDSQMALLKTLMTTRITPANDQWSMAVNMVPIEFRHRKAVIERWKDYVTQVAIKSEDQRDMEINGQRIMIKQIAMIHSIAVAMGVNITEGDLQATGYYSKGSTDRDDLVKNALNALPEIAKNTNRSAEIANTMVENLRNRP